MKVFISHAAGDNGFARELAEKLREAKLDPFVDEMALTPGQNWPLEIGRALDRADAMVVLLSPEAVKSPWVMREIDYALGERRFKGKLIPVMMRPTAEIPWVLRDLTLVDAAKDQSAAGRRVVERLKRASAAD